MELENFSVAIITSIAASQRIVSRLIACGIDRENILVVGPDECAEAAKVRPALCIWGLEEREMADRIAAQNEIVPAVFEDCLNIHVGSRSEGEHSRYVLEWKEFDTPEIEEKLRTLIEQAHTCRNYRVREHWYHMAVAEGNVGLWWWDKVLNFVYLSRHFQQMLKLSLAELPANAAQWLEMIHPSDRPGLIAAVQNQFENSTGHFRYECRIRHKGDQYRWYALSGQLGREELNRPRILGAAVDITEKKEAELQLAQANQRAQAANRAKNEFLTNMSHNLRTPLTAVMGFAEMLNDFTPNQAACDAIQSIQENSSQLMRLLEDILELSCIESTTPEPNLTRTSIDELLRSAVEVYHIKAMTEGLEFGIEVEPEIPPVLLADATRIRQILSRLIENAIKFTHQGEVSIGVHYDAQPTPTLEFLVVDTGIGIPADRRESIFAPFSQGDNSTSRSHAGSGLGLSICKRNAEILDGSLSVESEVEIGSRFTLRVPVQIPTSPPVSEPNSCKIDKKSELPCLDGRRVLLVEDGVDNQRLMKAFLQKAGATVVVAENGKIAVDWIDANRPEDHESQEDRDPNVDVILMDMHMPVMDGYEATSTLRARRFHKPIIAVTAHALTGDRQRCLDVGCDDYYTKPISRQTLLEMVHKYTEEASQLTAAQA